MVEQFYYTIVIVFGICYNKNYALPRRRNSRRDLIDYQAESGTKVALEYAVKKKRNTINVFTRSDNNV